MTTNTCTHNAYRPKARSRASAGDELSQLIPTENLSNTGSAGDTGLSSWLSSPAEVKVYHPRGGQRSIVVVVEGEC